MGSSSNPRAQLPMEKIWELLGRAGSGETSSCSGGQDGMNRQEGGDGKNWVGTLVSQHQERHRQSKAGMALREGKRGQVLKQGQSKGK